MSTIREATRPTLPARPAAPRAERRPFRDNPRLILLGIVVLIAALVAMVRFADSSTELNPDFLTEVVLYALSAADLTMLVALVFVLARNIIKLLVERRRGLPFSRFRAKLVLALLGLTIVPCVLVLIVGSELIRSSTEKWFSQPIDDVLAAATKIAQDYYRDREAARRRPRRADRARASRRRGRVGRSRRRAPRDRGARSRRAASGWSRCTGSRSTPGPRADVVRARRRRIAGAAAGTRSRLGRPSRRARGGRRDRRVSRPSRSKAAASSCAAVRRCATPRAASSAWCSRATTCRANPRRTRARSSRRTRTGASCWRCAARSGAST